MTKAGETDRGREQRNRRLSAKSKASSVCSSLIGQFAKISFAVGN